MKNLSAFKFIISLALEIAINRLKKAHNVYGKLSVTALVIAGGALVTPFWQQTLEGVTKSYGVEIPNGPIPSTISGLFFIILAIVFAQLSIIAYKFTSQKENLVDTKVISDPIVIGKSKLRCYCGSIIGISNIDVLVTSENRYLKLGGMDSTSVSGRVRRLAASFRIDGTISSDPLEGFIENWRKSQPHTGPYQLGTTVDSPPFNASSVGVKHIIHAIALEKRDDGKNLVDEASIRKIVKHAIDLCHRECCTSVFIPIFGLGSGGLSADKTISMTVNPLIDEIRSRNIKLDIYIGTYRLSDAAQATNSLLRKS
jgi:O-acetyl-ADP-ribose deacetylase (regulator of RNase III)